MSGTTGAGVSVGAGTTGSSWGCQGRTHPTSPAREQGSPSPGHRHLQLCWGSSEMLMFELLFWGMEREADFCLSLACIKWICRASLVLEAGGVPPALMSTSGALPLLAELWGR